jgi:chorismate mutase
VTEGLDDPQIKRLREEISDNDRALVDAVNRRLELVARLKSYKESRGLGFVDPEREEWMLAYLTRANRGPLTSDGLREIFQELLDLTKRELERAASASVADGALPAPPTPRRPRTDPERRRRGTS